LPRLSIAHEVDRITVACPVRAGMVAATEAQIWV